MIATDKLGDVFLSVTYRADGQSNIGVYRLDRTESGVKGPMRAFAGTGSNVSNVFTWNPVVLSDGTLFVPFQIFKGLVGTSPGREIFAAVSNDHGATFSRAQRIGVQMLDARNPVNPYGNVVFAADTMSRRFRDRIYMLWYNASSEGGFRLKLSYSDDKGKTWSAARDVDARPGSHVNAFRPAIDDGGSTFLEPAIVSSAESSLDAPLNFAVRPTIDSPRTTSDGRLEFSFNTTLGRFPDGGDYMGLAADAAGAFHPFWVDTRTGTFQAWTATVRVRSTGEDAPPTDASTGLTVRLRPIFDPATYDPQTGAEAIPVRFQNISNAPVCKPLIVIVKDPATGPHATPRVLNSDNGKEWKGAFFDYSAALGNLSCLPPGGVTEAVICKVKPLESERTFVTIRVEITHDAPKK
jgi:hypothetical protein